MHCGEPVHLGIGTVLCKVCRPLITRQENRAYRKLLSNKYREDGSVNPEFDAHVNLKIGKKLGVHPLDIAKSKSSIYRRLREKLGQADPKWLTASDKELYELMVDSMKHGYLDTLKD